MCLLPYSRLHLVLPITANEIQARLDKALAAGKQVRLRDTLMQDELFYPKGTCDSCRFRIYNKFYWLQKYDLVATGYFINRQQDGGSEVHIKISYRLSFSRILQFLLLSSVLCFAATILALSGAPWQIYLLFPLAITFISYVINTLGFKFYKEIYIKFFKRLLKS